MPSITMHSTQEPVTSRLYRDERDFWRVRELLLETYPITPPGFNWEVRRWDGSRFHNFPLGWDPYWDGRVRLWETGNGGLVGAAHPDRPGEAFVQLHPDYRNLEPEMIDWAEEHIAVTPTNGTPRYVELYAFEYDQWRQHLLQERGYVRTDDWGIWRRLQFGRKVIPPVRMPPGYTLRSAHGDDAAEHEQFAALLNAAFGRTFHKAADTRAFRATAPSYRPELDLFAIAPDGSLAANVGVIWMPEVRAGLFEPVCTHPAHRQKGLAKMLMWEGMHRLQALGASEVTVDTWSMVASNALYEAVGFPEAYRGWTWRKTW